MLRKTQPRVVRLWFASRPTATQNNHSAMPTRN
jgi:hypothetical protein